MVVLGWKVLDQQSPPNGMEDSDYEGLFDGLAIHRGAPRQLIREHRTADGVAPEVFRGHVAARLNLEAVSHCCCEGQVSNGVEPHQNGGPAQIRYRLMHGEIGRVGHPKNSGGQHGVHLNDPDHLSCRGVDVVGHLHHTRQRMVQGAHLLHGLIDGFQHR